MIRIEKLSYDFPQKELYEDISFSLEAGQHCALIGSNGCGKSTLVDMIIDPDKYLYDGKIIKEESCRIGYASQFSIRDKAQDITVFEYLSRKFIEVQGEIADVCEEMGCEEVTADETGEKMAAAFEKYQSLLDLNEAMDGDNYENNIHKQLFVAGMADLADVSLALISGGEYKLLQIMREMLLTPNLLVLDEPDVFLDFGNLNSLCQLINGYKGTLLVITHNRYLLNHCFNKILHLENCDLQEFDGSYAEYRCAQIREKLALRIQYLEEQDEIARTEELVDILRTRASKMVNPVIGRSVNAKQSQLDRLLARQIKAPFVDIHEPEIKLPQVVPMVEAVSDCESLTVSGKRSSEVEIDEPKPVLEVSNYQLAFDKELLNEVSFTLMPGEKAAIVGANGTGKTTLIRDILKNEHPAIHIDEDVKYACLSQLEIKEETEDHTYGAKEASARRKAKREENLRLSSGEQNIRQIEELAGSDADFLILDEPTSHLDLYAQMAFERALAEYKGTVLMVSHDFYLIANCADYVLLIEDNTVRRMRTRNFRKMVYDKYFDSSYLEKDRKKQKLEAEITAAFKRDDLAAVDKLCGQLEEICSYNK